MSMSRDSSNSRILNWRKGRLNRDRNRNRNGRNINGGWRCGGGRRERRKWIRVDIDRIWSDEGMSLNLGMSKDFNKGFEEIRVLRDLGSKFGILLCSCRLLLFPRRSGGRGRRVGAFFLFFVWFFFCCGRVLRLTGAWRTG